MNEIPLFVKAIVAVIAIGGGVVGSIEYFAKDADLETLAMDFNKYSATQSVRSLDTMLWNLEDRYGCHGETECLPKMQPRDKEIYRKLLQERSSAVQDMTRRKGEF